MPKPSAEKRRLVSNFEIKPIYHEKFLIDSFGLDMHKYKHAQALVKARTSTSVSMHDHTQVQI